MWRGDLRKIRPGPSVLCGYLEDAPKVDNFMTLDAHGKELDIVL